MSRAKPSRRPAGPRPSRKPQATRPSPGLRLLPLLLIVAVAAGATWWWASRRSARAPVASGQADSLDAQAAFLAGGKLGTAGRHTASVPFFRRAIAAGMSESWEGHFNLAAALINSALEVAPRLGRFDPALRSSYERVHSVFAGMDEARLAARDARTSRMRAYTAYQDAVMLQFWGMPWDALATAQIAASLDPGWELPRRLVFDLQRDLARGGLTP